MLLYFVHNNAQLETRYRAFAKLHAEGMRNTVGLLAALCRAKGDRAVHQHLGVSTGPIGRYSVVEVCDGYLAAEASGSSFG